MPNPPPYPSRLLALVALCAALRSAYGYADDESAAVEPVEPPPFTLEFANGDVLRGEALRTDEDEVVWRLATGDEIRLPVAALSRIERTDGTAIWTPELGKVDRLFGDTTEPFVTPAIDVTPNVDVADGDSGADGEGEEPRLSHPSEIVLAAARAAEATLVPVLTVLEPEAVFERAVSVTQRIELGGQFIDGNSESDSLNVSGKFGHETDRRKSELQFAGFLGSADGVFATNRWTVNSTVDFNRPKDARWLLFVTSRNEYDQFENLDYRGTLSSGLGYRIVKRKDREVLVRFGPGVTAEFYRYPYRRRITPDLFGQLEVTWPVFDRLVFEHDTTVNPAIDDFEIFRLTSRNGLKLPLDESERWNLKLGFRVDYDSQPNKDRLPMDYTTTLTIVYQRK